MPGPLAPNGNLPGERSRFRPGDDPHHRHMVPASAATRDALLIELSADFAIAQPLPAKLENPRDVRLLFGVLDHHAGPGRLGDPPVRRPRAHPPAVGLVLPPAGRRGLPTLAALIFGLSLEDHPHKCLFARLVRYADAVQSEQKRPAAGDLAPVDLRHQIVAGEPVEAADDERVAAT